MILTSPFTLFSIENMDANIFEIRELYLFDTKTQQRINIT